MAITDNVFTAEEFDTALSTNPELFNIVQGKILEKDDYKKRFEPAFASDFTKRTADLIEADTLKLTGIAKKPQEKYYDYWQRAIGEVKTNFASEQQRLTNEITLLKDKSNPDAATKARIEQLEKQLTDKDTEFATFKTNSSQEVNAAKVSAKLEASIPQLKIKAGLPEDLVKIAMENTVAKLLKSAQVQEDGTITFLDADGKVRQNTSTYKPLTALEALNLELKTIVDEGVKQPGAGSNPGNENPPKEGSKFTGVPATVTTQVQLSEHLLSLGIMDGSKEWNEIFKEHGAKLKLR